MCNTCGCNITEGNRHAAHAHDHDHGHSAVEVLSSLLAGNDRQAGHNRAHFDAHGVRAINLMSSPGAGKTALLEQTIRALEGDYRVGVIVGDLETENDADRLRSHGVSARQITTGSACHLDAHLVHEALHALDLDAIDLLFIENVGNLVCPASFDLGQHRNVALLAVTEGDDKPAKYPVMFRAADLALLTKCDLLEVLDDFDPARARATLAALGTGAPLLEVAARRTRALEPWLDWLHSEMDSSATARAALATS